MAARLVAVCAGRGLGVGAGHWRAMGGGGRASEGVAEAAKRAGSAGAQRARDERRVSFAQTAEVWEVASNTALERAAARADSELAVAAARRGAAAADEVEASDRAEAAGGRGATAAHGGRGWAAAERDALDALASESPPPAPRVPGVGARGVEYCARRERRVAHGSTKRDRPSERSEATEPRGAPQREPRGVAWAEALVVFAGEGGDRDLPARLRARGIGVTVVDTLQGGARHDVLRSEVGDALLRRVRRREFDTVFIATPCASYSVAHRPQLRSRRQPDGLASAPPEWRAYLNKHNRLARWTAELIGAAHAAGAAWALENPADRGDRLSPAWWPKYSDHAPIWLNAHVAAAIAAAGATKRTFAQCSFGAPWQKYTTIAHSAELCEAMAPLDDMGCTHGDVPHEHHAHGRDSEGRGRAAQAAAYPPSMNEFIAEAIAETLRRGRDEGAPRHKSRGQSGGHVVDGPGLFGPVAEACEGARHTAPRFASLRNKRATEAPALALEALPGDLHAPITPSRPPGRRAPRAGGGETTGEAAGRTRRAALRAARMALGPVPSAHHRALRRRPLRAGGAAVDAEGRRRGRRAARGAAARGGADRHHLAGADGGFRARRRVGLRRPDGLQARRAVHAAHGLPWEAPGRSSGAAAGGGPAGVARRRHRGAGRRGRRRGALGLRARNRPRLPSHGGGGKLCGGGQSGGRRHRRRVGGAACAPPALRAVPRAATQRRHAGPRAVARRRRGR